MAKAQPDTLNNWHLGIQKKRERWLLGNEELPGNFLYSEHQEKTTQLLNSWKAQLQIPGFHFLLDLDENLFDTFSYWVKLINRYLHLRFGYSFDELPTAAQVAKEGGPSRYYPQYYPHIFSSDFYNEKAFEHLGEEIRFRYNANRAGALMTSVELPQLINQITRYGTVLGGLTARPDVPAVRRATEKQIQDLFPVFYRSPNVSVGEASQEKLRVLQFLTTSSDASQSSSEAVFPSQIDNKGCLVLIDDSLSTARALGQANAVRLSKGGSKNELPLQIINGLGPLTLPQLEQGNFSLEGLEGIFLMTS